MKILRDKQPADSHSELINEVTPVFKIDQDKITSLAVIFVTLSNSYMWIIAHARRAQYI